VAAAAVMRASHRAAMVTAAPAAGLTSLPHEIRDIWHCFSNCRFLPQGLPQRF